MSGLELERMYLVVEHRIPKDEKRGSIVPDGISIMDGEQLMTILSINTDITSITTKIDPGRTTIDIFKIDLIPEHEKETFRTKASGDEVPWKEFIGYSWEGHSFHEVVILVPTEVVEKITKA